MWGQEGTIRCGKLYNSGAPYKAKHKNEQQNDNRFTQDKHRRMSVHFCIYADVVEPADTQVSGTCGRDRP